MIRVDTYGHLGFERSLAHAHGSIIQDQGLLYEQDGRVFLLHSFDTAEIVFLFTSGV